ncbi:hypothetical protein Tco_0410652 [Tanacetum coccineum]
MSDKKDKINKKRTEQDWSRVERTPDLIDYVYNKYGDVEVTDEMVEDLYDYDMMKNKFLSMVEAEKKAKMMVESKNVESEKIYRKLMATDDMVEYVLEKYVKNWKVEDEIADVILEDLQIKYGKGDDVDLVDADDVDLFASLDLENRVKTFEEDFTRLLKAMKFFNCLCIPMLAEVIEVSSDKDEDIVCFNDVIYPLTDVEIRMFKNTPIVETRRGVE